MKKFITNLIWFLSPCRKCKDKDLEGLVACSCTRGLFVKKYRKRSKYGRKTENF